MQEIQYPKNNYISTLELISGEQYFDSVKSFFAQINDFWGKVENYIFKLETRQSYDEVGNESFDLYQAGNVKDSFAKLPIIRSGDVDLYKQLQKKNVEFIRCRPIIEPISKYLRWEFEAYKFNIRYGEIIFIVRRELLPQIFDQIALHDFMVFDDSLAFIHNYNEEGVLVGGWFLTNPDKIKRLILIFNIIKSNSVLFQDYLKEN